MAAILVRGRRSVPSALESERKGRLSSVVVKRKRGAVRMVPRGTRPQGLPARMPDGVGLAGGGDTRQKGRASLPRVTTIP